MRKIFVVIVLLLAMTNLYVNANETKVDDLEKVAISPMYVAVNEFSNSFDMQVGGKTVYTSFLRSSVTNDVRLYGYVQQFKNGNWVTVHNVSNLSNNGIASLAGYYYVPKGFDYRYKVFGYAYANGSLIESVSWISQVIRF